MLRTHGDERVDDWYWLRDREDPASLAYLEAENAYTDAVMAHTGELQERLYEEIRGRVQESDESVPAKKDAHWYFQQTLEGRAYPIYCRRSGAEDAPEQVLLDANELARGHDFFALGAFAVSPDHRLLAYSTDTTGGERFTLRVRDLDRAVDLPDVIPETAHGAEWANDNRTLFYTRQNEAMRPWQLWRHALGTSADADVCVHSEDDERFYVSIGRTRSDAYLVLHIGSAVTSEVHVLPAETPAATFRVIEPRRQGVEYWLDHRGEDFLIGTNEDAPNFRLLQAPVAAPGDRHELVPHEDHVRLQAAEAFRGHVILSERAEALERIRILDPETGTATVLEQPEPVYSAAPTDNLEYDSRLLRFTYTSLVTPPSVYDHDLRTGERTLRKRRPVLGGYDPDLYATERQWANAPDGARVPISLVYRRDRPRDGAGPALLYGYGAYEHSIDPVFSSARLTLLDRGFLYAIAHVRGGGELGRHWYEEGKFERKPHTFTDFIACAEHLVAGGWTAPERLVARGASAGGLLMGAVANLRPDLFAAIVAEVPFVDVLTTILDESLPLTAVEWEEWGDPNEPAFYRLLGSYSPYDNVEAKDYPAMLVTAGLNDPRVGFWEPAKWVAKLRATKTDAERLLLRTELGAGHMGPSDRYEAWRREAFVYAFILDTLGLA